MKLLFLPKKRVRLPGREKEKNRGGSPASSNCNTKWTLFLLGRKSYFLAFENQRYCSLLKTAGLIVLTFKIIKMKGIKKN